MKFFRQGIYMNPADSANNFSCYDFTIMIKQDYFAN